MWNRRMLGATLANQLVLDRVASNNKLTDDGTKLSRSATRLTLNFPETAPTHTQSLNCHSVQWCQQQFSQSGNHTIGWQTFSWLGRGFPHGHIFRPKLDIRSTKRAVECARPRRAVSSWPSSWRCGRFWMSLYTAPMRERESACVSTCGEFYGWTTREGEGKRAYCRKDPIKN